MAVDEQEKISLPIAGAYLQPLQTMETPGGPVLHMLRSDYPLMPDFKKGFGEIYFSEVWPGHVKGWKCHRRQTQLFAVPAGVLRIVLYDERDGSPSRGAICELLLGRPDNYSLLLIPPLIWHAFAAAGESSALICNCADLPHDPKEAEKLPLTSERIPYHWELSPGSAPRLSDSSL